MWIRQCILIIVGISSGAVVASGLFSFIISLGIVAKFADRTRTGDWILGYETAIALGGIIGSVLYLYRIPLPYLQLLRPIIGLGTGIFVGCWAMSIAEVINIFPVFIRRVKLVRYIKGIVLAVALGKGVGMWLLYYVRSG